MKTLFIEARSSGKVKFSKKQIDVLPKKLALATTVQFIGQIDNIKKQLKDKKITLIKGTHSRYKGQILGCDILNYKLDYDVDAYLYVGDGIFHPKALMLKTEKPVFAFNPFNSKLVKLGNKEVEKFKKLKKGALLRFHSSDKIGVIVTTKPGQQNLKKAFELKKLKGKQVYIFLTNTLDFNQLENFPFIQCWVNTACPRLFYDDYSKFNKPVINIEDI